MTTPLLVLTLAYVAVAALLLSLNLATRHPGWVKALAIVLVSLLYFGTWLGYKGIMGWPSGDSMPEDFRVLWITIEDPDKAASAPGHIYYWVRTLDDQGLAVGAPRAYAVPWGEEAAEEAQRALDQMEEGEILNGRRTRGRVSTDPGIDAADDLGSRSVRGQDESEVDFEFYLIPPPSLPAKLDPIGID